MSRRAHAYKAVVKDLVLVVVQGDVVGTAVRGHEEAIPGSRTNEGIMQHDSCRAHIPYTLIPSTVEVLDLWHVELWAEWFIEQLDSHDNISIILSRILLANRLQNLKCLIDTITTLPARVGQLLARVVEAVLAERSAMQVDENLEASGATPADGFVQVVGGAHDVGCAEGIVSPKAVRRGDWLVFEGQRAHRR